MTAAQGGTYVALGWDAVSMLVDMGLWNRTHGCLRISSEISELVLPQVPPPVAWLLPFLDPIVVIEVLLLLAPCHLHFLKQQVSKIAKATTNQVLIQYQTIQPRG